jgi:hypothetical protein
MGDELGLPYAELFLATKASKIAAFHESFPFTLNEPELRN